MGGSDEGELQPGLAPAGEEHSALPRWSQLRKSASRCHVHAVAWKTERRKWGQGPAPSSASPPGDSDFPNPPTQIRSGIIQIRQDWGWGCLWAGCSWAAAGAPGTGQTVQPPDTPQPTENGAGHAAPGAVFQLRVALGSSLDGSGGARGPSTPSSHSDSMTMCVTGPGRSPES